MLFLFLARRDWVISPANVSVQVGQTTPLVVESQCERAQRIFFSTNENLSKFNQISTTRIYLKFYGFSKAALVIGAVFHVSTQHHRPYSKHKNETYKKKDHKANLTVL